MASLNLLIKPASSLCNLRCNYCFYTDISNMRTVKSHGIMDTPLMEQLIHRVIDTLNDGDEVTFTFQGGEPTLAGLLWFEHFVTTAKTDKAIKIHYCLQTNGILLNDAWCRFLSKHNFLVGLSIDGPAEFHDKNRLNACGKGTYKQVLQARKHLEQHHVEYNILCVLTNQLARYPKKTWDYLVHNHIKYIQFIPCLSDLESSGTSANALTPERFATFYIELFKLWSESFYNRNYISIKFFDDLFNLLSKSQVTSCGFTGLCSPQLVIEADGSVYPCDFYVLDEWYCGNIAKNSINEILNAPKTVVFLSRKKEFFEICNNCKYIKICGTGCPRMKNNMYTDSSKTFCGYRTFLESSEQTINIILQNYL